MREITSFVHNCLWLQGCIDKYLYFILVDLLKSLTYSKSLKTEYNSKKKKKIIKVSCSDISIK